MRLILVALSCACLAAAPPARAPSPSAAAPGVPVALDAPEVTALLRSWTPVDGNPWTLELTVDQGKLVLGVAHASGDGEVWMSLRDLARLPDGSIVGTSDQGSRVRLRVERGELTVQEGLRTHRYR